MAYKTVSQFKDSLSGILTGINLNNVVNLNKAIERTARKISTKIFIPSVAGKQSITLYDGVTDYTAPTDIYGASLIDLRPQGISRNITDYVYKQPRELFDRTKAWITSGYQVAFEFVNGTGRLRIVSAVPTPKIELDTMTDTTGWTAAGSASALVQDQTVFWQSPGSLRFTLTGNSNGTLTKTITSQDLTNYKNVGVAFLAIRTPSATSLTSIELRLGSSSSNYYSVTATTGFIQSFTANDWMLVSFDLSTATTVGSPTITAINYAQIKITHSATLTNFYCGQLFISLPSPHDFIYQTSSFFLASGSTPSQTITNDTDTIILTDAPLVIFEYEAANTIAQQQGGSLASGLIAQIDEDLNGKRARNGMIVQMGLYDIYRGNNPSEELRQVGTYYDY